MSSREIIRSTEVCLTENEKGQYIVSKVGSHPYAVRPNTRTYNIIRIFDSRCLAAQRRYECANSIINQLSSKLESIENSGIYKFFHALGAV